MKTLTELISISEPAMPIVRDWIAAAAMPCEVLPPAASRGEALVALQVTTRSPMGALVYETGGLLIDDGWLRFLGSGHPRLARSLPKWNEGRGDGFCLVADDAVGGFFAINGGGLGGDAKSIYYFAPNSLTWESLRLGYSDFLVWALSERLAKFYEAMRWKTWREDVRLLHGDKSFFFYPFLWAKEGSVETSQRSVVPVEEIWDSQLDFQRQLDAAE